jgi:hypothetical protein
LDPGREDEDKFVDIYNDNASLKVGHELTVFLSGK